jgi:hypothetical protein
LGLVNVPGKNRRIIDRTVTREHTESGFAYLQEDRRQRAGITKLSVKAVTGGNLEHRSFEEENSGLVEPQLLGKVRDNRSMNLLVIGGSADLFIQVVKQVDLALPSLESKDISSAFRIPSEDLETQ